MAFTAAGSLPFDYTAFNGGLNLLESPHLLTDNQARDVQNVQATLAGAIQKRNGLTTHSQPADVLTSLFALESVSPIVLVGAGGTSLYKIATGGTATSIKTALTSNLRWEFVSAPQTGGQGPLFGMNGTDTPQQWDGSAASTSDWTATDVGGAVPNGKYCVYVNNQVFVAGVAAHPSRVYWSAIGDPTGWNAANLQGAGFEDFDPSDGQAITALGTVGPYLLVAKPRKLYVLINPATGQKRPISDSVGCPAHRSMVEGSEGTYFLAEDRGVFVTNGSKLTPLSDLVQPALDGIQPGLRSQAAGAYFDAHYYLSFPTTTSTNDTTLDWDARLQSWWKHTIGSNQFAVWHPTGPSRLYSAKATSAVVDYCFDPTAYQDNGANFTWFWKGPWLSPSFYRRRRFPTTYFRKRLRQLRASGSGQVDFYVAKDYAVGETLIRSDSFSYLADLTLPEATWSGTGTWSATDGSLWSGLPTFKEVKFFMSQQVANDFSPVWAGTNAHPALVTQFVLMLTDRRDLVVT